MSFNTILSCCVVASMTIGLVDLLIGNRLGLAVELERGIMSAGRLVLIMTGFMTMAPVLSDILSPVVTPLLTTIGCDPSAFAGLFLANDSGGAALAIEMAIDPDAGLYNGFIVGSMLGSVVMFLIALTISFTTPRERPAAIYGLVCGIITIPFGCIFGGWVARFKMDMVLRNSIPCIVLSVILMLALSMLKAKIVPFFNVMGKGMLGITYFGLVVAALDSLLGIQLFERTGDLTEIYYIIGNIAVFLAGAFPLLAILRRILRVPLGALAAKMQINEIEVSGLIASLANNLPTFGALREMTPRGVMINLAFLVSASCVFGDHLAYTAQVAPEMVGCMVAGKLLASISAVVIALILASRLDLESEGMTQ